MNKVVLIGNLVRDVEVRMTQEGTGVLRFCLALSDRIKRGGEWIDYAHFIECVYFTKSGSLQQYLTKGKKVAVSGKLNHQKWQQDGQNRQSINVLVDNVELLGNTLEPSQQSPQGQIDHDTASSDIPF